MASAKISDETHAELFRSSKDVEGSRPRDASNAAAKIKRLIIEKIENSILVRLSDNLHPIHVWLQSFGDVEGAILVLVVLS